MIKISYISVKELSRLIKIHEKTLKAWLCHYSLSRFVRCRYMPDGKLEHEFAITKAALKALNKYLLKKNRKDLQSLNINLIK